MYGIACLSRTLVKTRQRVAAGEPGQVENVGLDLAQPGQRIDEDRKEREQEREQDLRFEAEPEPDHEQRRDRDLRNAVEGGEQRQDHALAWPATYIDEQREQHADDERYREARQGGRGGEAQVVQLGVNVSANRRPIIEGSGST